MKTNNWCLTDENKNKANLRREPKKYKRKNQYKFDFH